MSFLLDTDICSAYLKGARAVGNRFLQYTGGRSLSAITLGELYTWVLRDAPPKRLQSLDDMSNDVRVPDVARKFGEMRAYLLDSGFPPPDMDLLNTATALVFNFALVTHNTKDYLHVPGLHLPIG